MPISDDRHHILVDDVTAEKLEQLKKDGYSPACVIESSPGNHQVILTIPKLGLSESDEQETANRFTKEINRQYGDPKLSGAQHAHRLPPFSNFKPKHRREDGTFPETELPESGGGMCRKGKERLEEIRQALEAKKQEQRRNQTPTPQGVSVGADNPDSAYWAHYGDVMKRTKDSPDYSAIDARIGIRMRVTGYSPGQIHEAIKNNAPAMRKKTMGDAEYRAKYQYRNWDRFARETTEKFVFGSRGETQYRQAESYRIYYLHLEGRREQNRHQHQKDKQKDLGR